MASRTASLDISALSPSEYAAYSPWLDCVERSGQSLSPERMLQLVARAVGPLVYNPAREEEVRGQLRWSREMLKVTTDAGLLRPETAYRM
jgi:hypothetical protein